MDFGMDSIRITFLDSTIRIKMKEPLSFSLRSLRNSYKSLITILFLLMGSGMICAQTNENTSSPWFRKSPVTSNLFAVIMIGNPVPTSSDMITYGFFTTNKKSIMKGSVPANGRKKNGKNVSVLTIDTMRCLWAVFRACRAS
jgi:hypothetical protein